MTYRPRHQATQRLGGVDHPIARTVQSPMYEPRHLTLFPAIPSCNRLRFCHLDAECPTFFFCFWNDEEPTP